jgi:pimeloyl-ACP methyl ester carboxylesterase
MTFSTRSGALIAAALLLSSPLAALAAAPAPAAAPAIRQMDHISVQTMGTGGSPIILIPGLSSPREAWSGVAPELARTHRVYLVQVNGFGGDDPRANLRPGVLNGIVSDLRRLIIEQRLESPAIVGHSMGGLAGLMLAARHPGSVGRLMVVDALPYFGVLMAPPGTDATVAMVEPRAAQMRNAVAASYGKPADPAAAEANVAGMTLKPEHRSNLRTWAMASDPRVAAQAMYEDLTTDMRPELEHIRAPVTVVYAWNQNFPRKEPAAAFFGREYAGLRAVKVTEVGESAHFVMLDQPAAFQAALAEFLR